MPIAEATGAVGNTSCLVGTAEQVAGALLEYYKLGIHSLWIYAQPFPVNFTKFPVPAPKIPYSEIGRFIDEGPQTQAFSVLRAAHSVLNPQNSLLISLLAGNLPWRTVRQ